MSDLLLKYLIKTITKTKLFKQIMRNSMLNINQQLILKFNFIEI